MEQFIKYSLFVHVIAGGLALLSGLGAIIFRKKVKTHRPFGKIYLGSMWVIFITSLYVSVYKGNLFLLFIGIFTFHSCLTAYRSLKLKKLHAGQKPEKRDWLIETFNITACGGLLLFGILLLIKGNIQFAIICIAFGSLGLRVTYSNIQRFRGKYKDKFYWLLTHVGGMIGSYIGAITAFTVNNNGWMRLPQVVAWLGPTILLVPFIYFEFKRIRKPLTRQISEQTLPEESSEIA